MAHLENCVSVLKLVGCKAVKISFTKINIKTSQKLLLTPGLPTWIPSVLVSINYHSLRFLARRLEIDRRLLDFSGQENDVPAVGQQVRDVFGT